MANLKIIATLTAIALFSATVATGSDPKGVRPLSEPLSPEQLLETIIEKDGGPGVSAAVMKDGELLWNGAAGFADLEARGTTHNSNPHAHRQRVQTHHRGGTATSGRQKLIDLNADIRSLVTEFGSDQDSPISARMLAAHTSGVRQYDFSNYLDANNVYYYPTLADAFARIAAEPLQSEPGTTFHYSSIGYNVLGIAAERASKLSFGELVAKEVAAALNMENTLIDHPLEIIPHRTRFYTRFPDGVVRNTIWRDSSDYYPSGGMLSTAADLARLTDAVFGGEWLSENAMELLTTEATTTNGEPTGYTFGWQIVRDENGAVQYYEHGGETNGAHSFVRYYPDDKLAVAGVVNANFMMGEPYFFEAIREELPALFR